MSFDIFTVVII